jgi:predicted nucleotidyltransferase
MAISSKITKEIVKRVQHAVKPDRIILFGSAAKGQMTRDSDIDLLVLKKAIRRPLRECVPIYDALSGMGYPFDVVLMSTERFEESKNVVGGIAYPAHKYGKVLYAKI